MPAARRRGYQTRLVTANCTTHMTAHPNNKMCAIWADWKALQTTEGGALDTTVLSSLNSSFLHAHNNGYELMFRPACGHSAPGGGEMTANPSAAPGWLETASVKPVRFIWTFANDPNPSFGGYPSRWPIPYRTSGGDASNRDPATLADGITNLAYHHRDFITKLNLWLNGNCPGSGTAHPRKNHLTSVAIARNAEDGTEQTLNFFAKQVTYLGTAMTISESVTLGASPATVTIADPSGELGGLVGTAERFLLKWGTTSDFELVQIVSRTAVSGGTCTATIQPASPNGYGREWGTPRMAHAAGERVWIGRKSDASTGAYLENRVFKDRNLGLRTGDWDHRRTNQTQWEYDNPSNTDRQTRLKEAWRESINDHLSIFSTDITVNMAGGELFEDRWAGADSLLDHVVAVGAHPRFIAMITNLSEDFPTAQPQSDDFLLRAKTRKIQRGCQFQGVGGMPNTPANIVKACEYGLTNYDPTFFEGASNRIDPPNSLSDSTTTTPGTNKATTAAQGTWPGATMHTIEDYLVGNADNSPVNRTNDCLQARMPLPPTDATDPTVPSGVTASAASSTAINVSWTASTDLGGAGLVGYYVREGETLVATVVAPATSAQITGLLASTTHSYTVSAYDGAGNESDRSTAATATTSSGGSDTGNPTWPTGGDALGNLAATLVQPVSAPTYVALTWDAAIDDVGVHHYDVRRNGILIGVSYGRALSDTLLQEGQTYGYTVTAYDAVDGFSPDSATVEVSVPVTSTALGWITGATPMVNA